MMIKNIINKLIEINLVKKLIELARPNFIILYYHRVIEDKDFDYDMGPNIHLCVKKSEFEVQMAYIAHNYDLISIDDLYKNNFKCEKFSVAVTFDDGYKDNLEVAYPILKKYNIPSTIYIVSRNIISKPWAWWIELWNFLSKNKSFKNEDKLINIEKINDKKKYYFNLKNKIKKLNYTEQISFFNKLTSSITRENHDDIYLNLDDLKKIKNKKLITLGCHTHDHLCFSYLEKNEIEKQINMCKEIIEQKVNIPVEHFAYPYGSKEDLNFFEHEILEKLRFKTAVTTIESSQKIYKSFYLPRVSIGPFISIKDFKRKLTGFDIMIKKIINTFK
jgi:peptidoglycan/xylan/chitin deacetylase (PgdA/CDA1 family)